MLQEQTIPKETRINLPICRFVDLKMRKKCFLKIGEIKRRGKYSSEFYYANRNHLEETV